MLSQTYLSERLAFLFLFGLIFLQYPVLSIVNLRVKIAGIPVLFAYVFFVWVLIIILLLVLMELRGDTGEAEPDTIEEKEAQQNTVKDQC